MAAFEKDKPSQDEWYARLAETQRLRDLVARQVREMRRTDPAKARMLFRHVIMMRQQLKQMIN